MGNNNSVTLGELRQKKPTFSEWSHKHLSWLFDSFSLFYFFVFIFILGLAWMGYSLIVNYGTQLYGWDYQSQYVTLAYNFWDTWRNFFKTGVFQLYGTATYLGTDNIGSNSYYGLFDPFLFVCYVFPRSWVPQTFALATVFKGVAGAAAMRGYLKYLGVSEKSSRLGGVAFAFSGYVTFMEGFPSFVSMAFCIPLVMLGIDRVLKERKPAALVFGLFLLGMISFFFLVVVCIWGVLYALWRYFWTIKTRNSKENISAIFVGIFAFAVGILMAGWTLFPSLRESSLSGRTVSIGSAYLSSLKNAFLSQDFRTVFVRLFEMVGDNPGREMQGLVSFFYPTCNYLFLPLYKVSSGYAYDSWTASLFCYTPIIILFFIGLVSSVRRKEWSHLIAFALCAYLVFTDFAYFFFYAFSGDGYGRWYIVLVPLIIYFACQEFDRLDKEKKETILTGVLSALALTILTWVLCVTCISGKDFTILEEGAYFKETYIAPASFVVDGIAHSLLWEVYYEMGLDVAVSVVIIFFRHKDWLWKALIGFVAVETIVAGNLSFVYGSIYSYDASYNGGSKFSSEATEVWDNIDSFDGDTYYRAYMDGLPESNSQEAFGYNGTSCFHSLFNYDLAQLTRYSHMALAEGTGTKYGSTYYTKSWSGYYGNKRFAFDTALSMKYYAIENEGYGNCEAIYSNADNVPFGSTLVYGDGTTPFRVYQNPYVTETKGGVAFGHAVDHLYKNKNSALSTYASPNIDDFFSNGGSSLELIRNEETYLDGAIINVDNGDAAKIEKEGLDISFETAVPTYSSIKLSFMDYSSMVYSNTYDWWGPLTSNGHAGPTYFLTDAATTKAEPGGTYNADTDKFVLTPKNGEAYFNTDNTGAYFLMKYSSSVKNRVCFVGDTFNADGTVAASNKLLSYEYHSIASYQNHLVGSGGDLFGFYPEGRVKYIFFCPKNSDVSPSTFTYYPTIYMCERSAIEDEMAKLSGSDYSLSDAKYSTDRLTFDSDFSKKRLVVTSLGYDAGWKVTATDAAGNVTYPSVYNLDGGFVGFVAPEGSTTYVMAYEAPYLKVGVVAAIVSFAAFALYEGLYFFRSIRKEETMLSVEGSDGKPKKKKEETNPSEHKTTS